MNYPYIHFFNIQYWYCVIVSLFGAKCTDTQLLAAGIPLPSGSGTAAGNAGAQAAPPGFWEWLFGGLWHSGAASSASAPAGFLGETIGIFAAAIAVLWAIFSILSFMLSLVLLILIIVSLVGIFFIRIDEHARYGNLAPAAARAHPLRERWQALLESAMTADPKRWREAILGADAMLGELFSRLGYEGEATSERIRRVPEGAFANLPAAWEAHRIKNFVSAPSSHFILTQREAFRVMKLYERVFREFDFI